jgi:DNA-binding response OmpR family regulator
MQRILVVDPDESCRTSLGLLLAREGFVPVLADDGRTGFEKAQIFRPQLILSDLQVPGMSGWEICQQLRAEGLPTALIVLSAVADERDKVLLLERGADDYVVKPFNRRELLARLRAVLRRTAPLAQVLRFGEAEVDRAHRRTTCRGVEIPLTRAEYDLLLFFLDHPDRLVPREQLLQAVWAMKPTRIRGRWTYTCGVCVRNWNRIRISRAIS